MATTLTTRATIRVRPAPACDPPYEDEPGSAAPVTDGVQPTLDLPTPAPPGRAPAAPAAPPVSPPQRPPAQLMVAIRRFLATYLEIINGYRPAAHLRSLCHPLDAAAVVEAAAQATDHVIPVLRAPGAGRGARQVALRRLRLYQPRPDAAEVAAVVGTDRRAWAVALRVERHRDGWLCAAAHLLWSGQPPRQRQAGRSVAPFGAP